MDLLSTINEWITTARELIAKDTHIPLIDSLEIDLTNELVDAWMDGDTALREVLENVLSRDPEDTAIRLVTLSSYYQLMTLNVPEKEEEVKNKRREFREQLVYFISLRDINDRMTLRDIRWEITNACAVDDHERAIVLCNQLRELLPATEHHYLMGRLHFLIGLAHIWDWEQSLVHWDLPIGPKANAVRGVYNGLNLLFLYGAGINKITSPKSISEDDKDHRRDAIKHLERARTSHPTARFMLARSYSDIGDHHNAAIAYQWMLDHYNELLAACAAEAGPLWDSESSKGILPAIYECLVNEFERDGAIDKAITVTTAWITAFPEQLGTYERLARLCQARGDYHAAYDWLRKEADRNPTLSEDPNVSIALALGSISATANNIDDTLAVIGAAHQDERRLIHALLLDYWPAYQNLSPESRDRWATGTWLRTTSIPHAPGLAAHSFAWVVERELRTTIIDKFRETITPALLNTTDDEARLLRRYLQGVGKLSLGQMLTTIDRSARSPNSLLKTLSEWLKRQHPWFIANFHLQPTGRITALRNREDHADLQTISADDAAAMARTCRGLLDILVQPRR